MGRCAAELSIAHRIFAYTRWYQGDYAGARAHYEQGIAAYDPTHRRALTFRYGHDPGPTASVYLALVLWVLGDVDRARQMSEQALADVVEGEHGPTIAIVHCFACMIGAMRRDHGGVLPHAEALLHLHREHGLQFLWGAMGNFFRGWAQWCAGDQQVGETGMQAGIAILQDQRFYLWMPILAGLLAQRKLESRRPDAGLAILDNQLAETERSGQRWFDAELRRFQGEALLRSQPVDATAAEDAFRLAVETARSQQARTFELRAALSLARLYHSTGRNDAARDVLTPVLVSFTARTELVEIGEAQALLASLT
jgi:predicted ATPase